MVSALPSVATAAAVQAQVLAQQSAAPVVARGRRREKQHQQQHRHTQQLAASICAAVARASATPPPPPPPSPSSHGGSSSSSSDSNSSSSSSRRLEAAASLKIASKPSATSHQQQQGGGDGGGDGGGEGGRGQGRGGARGESGGEEVHRRRRITHEEATEDNRWNHPVWRTAAVQALVSAACSLCLMLPAGAVPSPAVARQQTGAQQEASLASAAVLEGPAPATTAPETTIKPSPGVDGTAELDPHEALVREAWRVVDENFLDAKGHGFSREQWARRLGEALGRGAVGSAEGAHNTISALLRSLGDPYTRFLTPSQFAALAKYDLTGVGLNIGESREDDGSKGLRVLGLVLGSPSQRAGLLQGDEVLRVNGASVAGMSPFQASTLIQSAPGTRVELEVRRDDAYVKTFSLERAAEVRSPVFARLERGQGREVVGYVKLREFNAVAQREVAAAIENLRARGATAFVLDLQDNPGGLVQAGIEVSRLFLDENATVLYTEGRGRINNAETRTRSVVARGPAITKAPLVVLVNGRTASASELVAAALHDNCRAVLVGRRTYGKGLIQSVYELSDGSGVVLTVGRYITPARSDIDGRGIEPDYARTPGLSAVRGKLESCTLPPKIPSEPAPEGRL